MTDTELSAIEALRSDMDERFERQAEKLEAFRVFLLRAFLGACIAFGSGVVTVSVIAGGALSDIEANGERARVAEAKAEANADRIASLEASSRVTDDRFARIQETLASIAAELKEINAREMTRGFQGGRP